MPTRAESNDVKVILQQLCKDSDFLDLLLEHLSVKITEIINTQCGELRAEVKTLHDTVKERDCHIEHLRRKCDDLEQYSRRNNIRIFGVNEEKQENSVAVVLDVFNQKMGLSVKESDIDRAHRTGKIRERSTNGDGSSGPPSKSVARPIIVRFTNYSVRSRVFNSKTKLKGTKVSIREDLTKNRLEDLSAASGKYGLRNVWTRDGIIFCRRDDGIHRIGWN